MVWFVFLPLVCLSLVTPSFGDRCPEECACFNETKIMVICSSRGLTFFPNFSSKVEDLDLSKNKIDELPKRIKKLNQLTRLDLSSNQIKSVDFHTFEVLNSLEILDLSNNEIGYIHSEAFCNNTELKLLNLSRNPLQKLFNDYYLVIPSLEVLDVSECKLNHLKPTLLAEMPSLQKFVMSGNSITSVPAKMFQSNMELVHVDLSNNTITSLNFKLFKNNSELRHLNLSRNKFHEFENFTAYGLEILDLSHCEINTLSKHSLSNMPRLSHLNLSYNANLEFEPLDSYSLLSLDLRHCELDKLDKNSFSNMTRLDTLVLSWNELDDHQIIKSHTMKKLIMTHCEISELTQPVLALPLLENLDLSYCRVAHLNSSGLSVLRNLKYLNLIGNRLTTLTTDVFSHNPLLEELELADNVWNCDCELQDMRKFINWYLDKMHREREVKCDEPENLNDRLWLDVCRYSLVSWWSFIYVLLALFVVICLVVGTLRALKRRKRGRERVHGGHAEECVEEFEVEERVYREPHMEHIPRVTVSDPPTYEQAILMSSSSNLEESNNTSEVNR